jgi:hypothetical protein
MFPVFARSFASSVLFPALSLCVDGFCADPKFGLYNLHIRVLLTFDLEFPHVELTS